MKKKEGDEMNGKKSESSSGSSSSYTAESLAIKVTRNIMTELPAEIDAVMEDFIYKTVYNVINLVVKDTLAAEQKGQKNFNASLYTDLERVLNRLK